MMLNLLLLMAAATVFWGAVDLALEGTPIILVAFMVLLGLSLVAIAVITWGNE